MLLNKTKSLQLLLDLGQDSDDMVDRPVSCVSGVELSAIQAAVLAENTDCISVLFHNGATIAKAVSFAGKQNKTKSLQLLLDIGQDPDDMVDEEDCVTSLMWAAAQGHHECVQILATAKADIILEPSGFIPNSVLLCKDLQHFR